MPDIERTPLQNRAAIYIRVSTQLQIDKDSLHVQRRELAAYAELVLGIHEYEVFEDPGYSGKDTSRPAYQQMMTRIRMGEFSHLLVWKIDRISRNLLDFAAMYAELKHIGVTFVSKNEQFDTSTAIGEAMLKIILVFAELERKMTAERVTAVMLSRANNGQWNGGRVPFGYDWDSENKQFLINEKEADQYRYMCSLYEEKHSITKVCAEMNRRGIPTKTGGKWNTVGIHKILTSVFYLGTYRYNVHSDGKGIRKRDASEWIDIEGHHPALITQDRFRHIGYILKKNAKLSPRNRTTYQDKAVHIFAGLLTCGVCGKNMTATQGRRRASGYRPSIYGCASRRRNASACTNKYTTDLYIAPDVFAVISGVLTVRDRLGTKAGALDIEKEILSRIPSACSIEGLSGLADSIQNGVTGMEYTLPTVTAAKPPDDMQDLIARKKKCEASLKRLQTLFIYGEEGIAEKDYIIERKRIQDEISRIDDLLEETGDTEETLSEQEFRTKASYFLMINQLLGDKPKDTEEMLRLIDPKIPKDFVNTVIDNITVTDGTVETIRFKSGVSVRIHRR